MNINPKSQKGAITLIVLVTMLFLIAFLMSMYIRISNKAQTSAETTEEIARKYNNIGEANDIYNSYFANSDVIPIYTVEQLKKIGSGEKIEVNGKIYTFTTNGYYTLMNDLDLGGYYDETAGTWTGTQWEPLPLSDSNGTKYEFTGTLDGLGHDIKGLYINDEELNNQGLFGILTGTVKNLSIEKSYIKAKTYVGAIAGKNEGIIKNCYNTGSIIGETNVTGGYFKSITTGEQIEVWSDSILDENAYFVSGSYTATAPKGFRVSKNVFEQTIEDGMVIQDTDGNEFVWVPVEVTSNDSKTNIAAFYRSEWQDNERYTSLTNSTTYIEPYTGNEWEVGEYNAMLESVYNNGGFYIGRYEAGSTIARKNIANGTTKMVVKRNAYPYNFVSWGATRNEYTEDVFDGSNQNQGKGALYLSKNMYDGQNIGVTSSLCYGIQWDAMLDFVKDSTHNVTDSTTWGNYPYNEFIFSGEYSTDNGATWISAETTKPENSSWLLKTGASETNKAKNIYDLAGNIFEWTMEVNGSQSVLRGGGYNQGGDIRPSACRIPNRTTTINSFIGFRPMLYIK